MTNTQANIGIRRFIRGLNDYRNFEPGGSTQYYCGRQPLTFLGSTYNLGDALPFDLDASYSKKALAQLELFWNHGWVYPLDNWDDVSGNWDDVPGNFDDVGGKP